MKQYLVSFCTLGILIGCGPQSYDECLLSNTKGQPLTMIHTAENICEKKFPYLRNVALENGDYSVSWKPRGDAIDFKIVKEHPEYSIKKINAFLFKSKCSNVKDFSLPDSTVTLRFNNNLEVIALSETALERKVNRNGNSTIKLNHDEQFNCLIIKDIYGIRKK